LEFVARVMKSKVEKYETYRVTIPHNVIRVLGLDKGDLVRVTIRKTAEKVRKAEQHER
jgi:bifunctional DNA-binding transcriptional regulator/antitoxin component of YhaV-PrlF toxin-antitoxin module